MWLSYSRRRPDHQEGLRVATPLLADVPDTGRFDSEWESAAVSEVLATLLLPPIGVPFRPARLRELHRALRSQPGLLRRSRAHGAEA